MRIFIFALFIVVVLQRCQPVSADIIFFSPDTATATNSNLAGASPTNLINLSGISSTPVTLTNIGTILHSDSIEADAWRGSATAMPITLTFDFNSSQQIEYVGLWQALDLREGVRDFNLTFWDAPGGTGSQVGSVYFDTLDTGSGGDNSIPLNGRAFDVGTRTGVRSIEMEVTSIAHEVMPHVHLGEFMVGATAIPEPSSLALLGIGAVGMAVAARRRRKKQAVV